MGQKSVFNNNADEKLQRTGKLRQVLLSLLLAHHIYALCKVIIASASVDHSKLSDDVNKTLDIHINMSLRFMTTWNFVGQLVYIIMELAVINLPSTKYTRSMQKLSWMHFLSILWPSTYYIMGLYWPLYNYDRELIFPSVCDIMLPQHLNHSMHTMILMLLFVEALTSPRDYLPNTWLMRFINLVYMLVYSLVLNFTFIWDDVWMYPFLAVMSWNQRYLLYFGSFASCQAFTHFGLIVLGRRATTVAQSIHKVQ